MKPFAYPTALTILALGAWSPSANAGDPAVGNDGVSPHVRLAIGSAQDGSSPHQMTGSDYCSLAKRMMCVDDILGKFAPRGNDPNRLDDSTRAGNDTNTDLTHYDLDITIVPTTQNISGSNTITFNSLVDGLTTFPIQLSSNFTISALTSNGVSVTSTRIDSANVTVNLDRPYNTGEQVAVKITYSGTPTSGGTFGSIIFRTRSGAQEVYTLSETDYAYTWWPVKAPTNRDKCTADLKFTVPNALKVASNGVLQSTTPVGSTQTQYYWKTNYPTATYLYCFAATNFNTYTNTWTFTPPTGPTINMPLNFWIYPNSDTTSNRNVFFNCTNMLTAYSQTGHYGVYPFANEKYGIYNFGFGGGMEHQTSTGEGVFDESVTAHELGHQWWGDMITCADWHHIWLNEGFADYTEALWAEWKPGSTGTPALLSAMASRRPSSVNGTVWCPSTTDQNRIFSNDFTYYKGGWVLHMLRHIVGDTNFFNGLAAYRSLYQYGAATTEDFQGAMESVYGSSLNTFFQQWIYQPGAPAYQWNYRTLTIAGQTYVELYLHQSQSASYPTYVMPIDVVTYPTGSGSTTTVIQNNAATQWFLLKSAFTPAIVQVDPNKYILATANTNVTFVQGPPRVVTTSPAPGAGLPSASVSAITLTFQEAVNASGANFTITGPSGSVPFTYSFDSGTNTATLTLTAPLASGAYTVTALDSITETLGGKALDGEMTSPANPNALPSGDGIAGGSFTYTFNITAPPPCTGDVNGDRRVDTADLGVLLGQFGSSVTPGTGADFNGDGVVNSADLGVLLSAFGNLCP